MNKGVQILQDINHQTENSLIYKPELKAEINKLVLNHYEEKIT